MIKEWLLRGQRQFTDAGRGDMQLTFEKPISCAATYVLHLKIR